MKNLEMKPIPETYFLFVLPWHSFIKSKRTNKRTQNFNMGHVIYTYSRYLRTQYICKLTTISHVQHFLTRSQTFWRSYIQDWWLRHSNCDINIDKYLTVSFVLIYKKEIYLNFIRELPLFCVTVVNTSRVLNKTVIDIKLISFFLTKRLIYHIYDWSLFCVETFSFESVSVGRSDRRSTT